MWHVRGERWESIPHRVLRDKRLTFRARGLLCYLLSLPDDWQTSISRLRELTPAKEPGSPYEGREALETAVRELEKFGYLYRWPRRTERGHVSDYVWAFSADPDALRAMLAEQVPTVVDRAVGNSTIAGSAVTGSAGNGADQAKTDRSADRTGSGATVAGSHATPRRTDLTKNWKKNPRERAPMGAHPTGVTPVCGQCDARPDDPISARVVWLDDERTRSERCHRCHPRASEVAQ
jgi:hypothetical protein